MPNWNNNSVRIDAPLDQVSQWLIPLPNGEYEFDLHKLFPEMTSDDPAIEELTGSKRNPNIEHFDGNDDRATLGYDSARTPNNGTLRRLHELTGWRIENEFEESGVGFEGTFVCCNGTCHEEEHQYHPRCDVCDLKFPPDDYVIGADDQVCRLCRAQNPKPFPPDDENPWPNLFTRDQYHRLVANGEKQKEFRHFDPHPVVKLFNPEGSTTWLLASIESWDPNIALGFCDDGCGGQVYGSFDLGHLSERRGKLGKPIERDPNFTATKPLGAYAQDAIFSGQLLA
jgi:hypothetical protein